jgi:hypothetical protein
VGAESEKASGAQVKRRTLAFVGIASLALATALVVGNWPPHKPAPPSPDLRAGALAESLATARAAALANLAAWEAALQDRDTVIHRVIRYVVRHDTAWRDTGSLDTIEVVRWLALSDSTQRVRGDSLAGELVQCRYDADQCAEEIAKRPTSCNEWSAFGIGVGVGAAASAAACLMVR